MGIGIMFIMPMLRAKGKVFVGFVLIKLTA